MKPLPQNHDHRGCRLSGLAGALTFALVLGGCSYTPVLPSDPFLCGTTTPQCPDGYACVTDGARQICAATTGLDGGSSHDAAVSDGSQNACSHDVCTVGIKLTDSCNACVTEICTTDDYCCVTKWSSTCVSEVTSICDQTCP